MKKIISLVLVLVVLSSAFLFNVGKASAASSYPTLVDTHYVYGKGIVFVFDLNGARVRAPNIKNSTLYLNSNTYHLSCWVNRANQTIVCTARGGLTEFAGDQGTVSLLGRLYSVIIPSLPEPQNICNDCCIECDY